MMGHVMRTEIVADQGSCRVMCYIEPNCMSLNIGPLVGGLYKCELNNATKETQGASTLHEEMDYIYLEIEVNIWQSDSFSNLRPMWVYALFVNRHIFFVCFRRISRVCFHVCVSTQLCTTPQHVLENSSILHKIKDSFSILFFLLFVVLLIVSFC